VGKPLLDVLRDVVLDPAEQAAFTHDPSSYLEQYGYGDVAPDDLSEAFGLVADTMPPDVAQAVAATAPASSVPPSPVDDLDDDVEGGAFGDVTQDFDAVADPVDALDADLDDDGDFGTGEVSVLDVDDDAAFGEGFETESLGTPESPDGPDGFGSPSFEEADFGNATFTPEASEGPDDLGDYDDGVDDVDGFDADDPGDLPDDPGEFLDDIGSF